MGLRGVGRGKNEEAERALAIEQEEEGTLRKGLGLRCLWEDKDTEIEGLEGEGWSMDDICRHGVLRGRAVYRRCLCMIPRIEAYGMRRTTGGRMDVGTASPISKSALQGIHHLLSPSTPNSARVLRSIHERTCLLAAQTTLPLHLHSPSLIPHHSARKRRFRYQAARCVIHTPQHSPPASTSASVTPALLSQNTNHPQQKTFPRLLNHHPQPSLPETPLPLPNPISNPPPEIHCSPSSPP